MKLVLEIQYAKITRRLSLGRYKTISREYVCFMFSYAVSRELVCFIFFLSFLVIISKKELKV